MDFKENTFVIFADKEESKIDIKNLAMRHVQAETLKPLSKEHVKETRFHPVEITKWLMRHTQIMPSPALLQVLEIQESTEVEAQRTTENGEVPEAQVKAAIAASNRKRTPLKVELGGLYENAMPLWDAYIDAHGTEPTRGTIAQLLKETHDLPWRATSIERALSHNELLLKYKKYKSAA